ncbi:MAG: glycoside hydrolase family 3 C-terminal domain-containing protein [Acidobacteriota bacterium]|nr:glycoside hydrolase family 3 C-terminal domain-containing protein [Acidobacteriota bacterium]
MPNLRARNRIYLAGTTLLLIPIAGLIFLAAPRPSASEAIAPYRDLSLPVAARVNDLVSRMTLDEKMAQLVYTSPVIDRLGIPAYNWGNECLHGVAQAGVATVFPQSIGLGATWDAPLIHSVAEAISDEGRAKYHDALRQNRQRKYYGLTFFSPNVNIFRDPRWGRGQETYGEDPYLTARLGVAYVQGLQGDDPHYLKVVSTPKHFAAHSGPEPERHRFNAQMDERDLRETYLPAFEACLREGKAFAVMGAYSRLNGEADCASHKLLDEILRREWGFRGYVVSDCQGIRDIFENHHLASSVEEASAMALKAGCDLNCGNEYMSLPAALKQGLVSEADVDTALKRLLEARFRLGMFDPPEKVPYARIPFSVVDSGEHRALSLQAARESIVLLKNDHHLLPLSKALKSIAVVGPNANDVKALLGNYYGTPSLAVTPVVGIRQKVSSLTRVIYAKGCEPVEPPTIATSLDEAVRAAQSADVVVVALGLSGDLENEQFEIETEGFYWGDRTSLDLPRAQEKLLEAVAATGKPIVLLLLNGGPITTTWASIHAGAIVEAWYPGEEGGTAIADVLFGDYNPGGRLPVTIYKSVDQLPPFGDYKMAGRTYRYFSGEPLYPFGYGLSFTHFQYLHLETGARQIKPTGNQRVSVEVRNSGTVGGDEVVQLYLTRLNSPVPVPIRALAGFSRVYLKPGESKVMSFNLTSRQLSVIDNKGKRVVLPGQFRIEVGGKQPGFRGTADASTTAVLSKQFEVAGAAVPAE